MATKRLPLNLRRDLPGGKYVANATVVAHLLATMKRPRLARMMAEAMTMRNHRRTPGDGSRAVDYRGVKLADLALMVADAYYQDAVRIDATGIVVP